MTANFWDRFWGYVHIDWLLCASQTTWCVPFLVRVRLIFLDLSWGGVNIDWLLWVSPTPWCVPFLVRVRLKALAFTGLFLVSKFHLGERKFQYINQRQRRLILFAIGSVQMTKMLLTKLSKQATLPVPLPPPPPFPLQRHWQRPPWWKRSISESVSWSITSYNHFRLVDSTENIPNAWKLLIWTYHSYITGSKCVQEEDMRTDQNNQEKSPFKEAPWGLLAQAKATEPSAPEER